MSHHNGPVGLTKSSESATTLLVGIDCATDDARVGIALGEYGTAAVEVRDARVCARKRSAASSIAEWLEGLVTPALLAIDAPLGWPQSMTTALANHQAGEKIGTAPNEMFRRATDRFIQKELGKTPLDVGADRIARTAHAALLLLDELRKRLNAPIPLAWSSTPVEHVAAIEVYPAATLVAHGLRSCGYKARNQLKERQELVCQLSAKLQVTIDLPILQTNADALDAVVCLLAAKDFLAGQAVAPSDQRSAEQEGWIWAARHRGK